MKKLAMALGIMSLMSATAHSQSYVSGDYWVSWCSKGAPEMALISCGAYVRGVADALIILQKAMPPQAKTCIPSSLTGNKLAELAFPYVVKQSPEVRQYMASALLIAAFHETYPCESN
jgi:hypothetical protein